MKKNIFLLFLITVPSAYADNWVKHNTSSKATFYIETETIRKDGDYIYFWNMVDLLDPLDESGYLSIKSYEKVDCDMFKYQRLAYVFYSENMGTGTSDYEDSNDKSWKYAVPGTINSSAIDFACSFYK
jgi:hypothetical protein